jgi:hypothetical protein
MADEVKRTNIQGGQVVPVFLRALRRTNNDHRDFGALILQVPYDIAVGAIDQPKATKTGQDIFLTKPGSNFLNACRPHGIDRIAL